MINASELSKNSVGNTRVDAEDGSSATPRDKVPQARRLVFLVAHLVGGNSASMVIRLVGGILQGRLVAPATLGLFTGIGLTLRYAPFFQLGILDGLYRELPYYIGRGDRARAFELASAAQAWALVVGCIYALVLLCIGGWNLVHADYWMAAGWGTFAIQSVVFYYKTYYLQVTYRTAQDFSWLALSGVIESVFSLLLLIVVAWFQFYGLCLRALLVSAIGTGLLFIWCPIRVWPSWNVNHLKHLLRVGLPIFSVGQLYSLWTVLNATLVLKFTGVEGMGLYSMVMMTSASIELIPGALKQVIYPRMAAQYGKTHRVSELVQIALKPIILTALGLLPIIALSWWLVGPAVKLVVPAYSAAIPAMQWAMLLSVVHSFYPMASIFQVVRRQKLYGVAVVVGIASYTGAQLWLIRDEVTLAAFPQAMLIGRTVFAVLCSVLVAYLLREERGDRSRRK